MGYGYYEIETPEGELIERGYGVSDTCKHEDCNKKIDRGFAYLCGSCTWYFCSDHLYHVGSGAFKQLGIECFYPHVSHACLTCYNSLETDLENLKLLEDLGISEDE